MNETEDIMPVIQWLSRNRGKIVISEVGTPWERKLYRSILSSKATKRYAQSGTFVILPASEVTNKKNDIKAQYNFKSNDLHIIALAILGNVKVLVSKDRALHSDFKNIIGGRIYQYKDHARLLTANLCP